MNEPACGSTSSFCLQVESLNINKYWVYCIAFLIARYVIRQALDSQDVVGNKVVRLQNMHFYVWRHLISGIISALCTSASPGAISTVAGWEYACQQEDHRHFFQILYSDNLSVARVHLSFDDTLYSTRIFRIFAGSSPSICNGGRGGVCKHVLGYHIRLQFQSLDFTDG